VEYTPMMRQYLDIKEKNSDCILFFRLGDFYEMFGDDARLVSKELELTLTTRDRAVENPDERIPMCGVPYHSSEAYIARLIAKGYKVAICEQLEDPATAKGLVDRDIVRIITPGTVMEPSMLDEGRANYICAVYVDEDAAVCFADISTGEISVTDIPGAQLDALRNELSAFTPSEAILGGAGLKGDGVDKFLRDRLDCFTQTDNSRFEPTRAREIILQQFGITSLSELDLTEGGAETRAVGGLLSYLNDTQKTQLRHINTLRRGGRGEYMELDAQTARSLELVASMRTGEKKGSLLWVLDRTKTPMGRRLIRQWTLRPLLRVAAISRRQNAVNELVGDTVARGETVRVLRDIGDMERLIGRAVYGSANGRDLKSLGASIAAVSELLPLLAHFKSNALRGIAALDTLGDIGGAIDDTIADDPPFSVREGGIIRPGVSSEIDRLRDLMKNSGAALTDIELREREKTGLKLKIGYNRVFGYYIEIPRSQSENVPPEFIRKQTLVNCERFITQELKTLETELLTAKDNLTELEYQAFIRLRESVAAAAVRVQETAARVAELDALCSFAETAVSNGYCMPEVDASGIIDIRGGRHPVVEKSRTDTLFVPNDTYLDNGENVAAIITGPNMAGKSTFMRQTALITLMAQIGSFVPAKSAHIGVVDRVFTRIGASDDLSAGMSTFMVEMTEVAEILKNATRRSLLILDEIGRGTSTYDGMAIARAVLEYCADKKKLGAKTLFATHYHELIEMESELPGIKNFNISAKKRGGDVIFLRKIVKGGADESYGIEVAGLTGVPASVITRAKSIMESLPKQVLRTGASADAAPQMTLEDVSGGEIAEILGKTDINTLTPLEAMNLLFELKKKVRP
jgi:DNA mismatch repair protein MutS